jgi:hypothetical protein
MFDTAKEFSKVYLESGLQGGKRRTFSLLTFQVRRCGLGGRNSEEGIQHWRRQKALRGKGSIRKGAFREKVAFQGFFSSVEMTNLVRKRRLNFSGMVRNC